jgi:site-specific recombinase XerD
MTVEEIFARFDGAYAKSTIRSYQGNFARFSRWCEEAGADPLNVSPEELARFIDYLGEWCAAATVLHHIAGIGTIYRLSERPPVEKSPPVLLAMKRLYRAKGRWQKQAIPLTREVLHKLLQVCDDSNRGLRDRVMLRLGYDTMRRSAELCSFRFEDMELHPSGRAALHLRFSKTDQMGDGKLIPIGAELQEDLARWAERTGGSGYIVRRVYHSGDIGTAMETHDVRRHLRDMQARAGLELGGNLTAHSFRVGAALDLLESGVSMEKIMLRGGWESSSTVIKYLRAWQLAR